MQANSYATPAARGGNREDLRDVLTILEPESFPYTSMVRKTDEAAATLTEVLADTLRKPRISGTREGQSAGKGNNKASKRQRFGVYQHRVMDEYGVTDVQQAISKKGGTAAVANEFAYGKAKTLRELKRDMEAICCSDQDHVGGSDAEMQTRGCFKWLQPSATASFTAPAVPAEFLPLATSATGTTTVSALKTLGGAATTATLTEDDMNLILIALSRQNGGSSEFQGIFGDAIVNVVDHFSRTATAATAGRYVVNDNADKHEITMMVKVFSSSAGRVNVLPTQFNKWNASTELPDPSAGLILKLDLWYIDTLEAMHAVDPDEEDAGGEAGYAKCMFSNNCKMPRGNGKITQS